MPKRAAFFDITPEVLGQFLRLPDGVKITRLGVVNDETKAGDPPLRVVLEGDENSGFEEVPDGQPMPRKTPQYGTVQLKGMVYEFQIWG